ncbi:hypothetical protein EYR36_003168 [Pleurotus pulmonarius]|nr:hypothetical protein EYR36_003168 [Pleurotus pulmonarius]
MPDVRKSAKALAEFNGDVGDIKPGAMFRDRRHLSETGVHLPLVQGIHSVGDDVFSVVLCGGYEDDVDNGEEMVIRGDKLNSVYAPNPGGKYKYRYDGLYVVDEWWEEKGKAGYMMCMFRLKRFDDGNVTTLSSPMPNDDQASRRDRFISAWYPIRDELVQYMEQQQLPKDTCDRYRNNLNYNVLGGKLNRGMSVIDSAEILLGRSLTDEERNPDDYAFFWTTSHINGWASQWYPASFTAVVTISGSAEEVTFPSTEHWMMFQKALLFGDHAVAREVAGIEGTSKGDMAYVKSLGRKVKNFDDETWKLHRERIVFEGNLHKFRQHAELKSKLLATGEKEIVEASPHDKIWGIGYGEQAAISRGGLKWGLNLLGKALLQVREALKQEDARRTWE